MRSLWHGKEMTPWWEVIESNVSAEKQFSVGACEQSRGQCRTRLAFTSGKMAEDMPQSSVVISRSPPLLGLFSCHCPDSWGCQPSGPGTQMFRESGPLGFNYLDNCFNSWLFSTPSLSLGCLPPLSSGISQPALSQPRSHGGALVGLVPQVQAALGELGKPRQAPNTLWSLSSTSGSLQKVWVEGGWVSARKEGWARWDDLWGFENKVGQTGGNG
jgi:hypothetical protein